MGVRGGAGKHVVDDRPGDKLGEPQDEVRMELLDQARPSAHATVPATPTVADDRERAARRALRAQIARLERELAVAFVTAFPMGGLEPVRERPRGGARVLDLGELERVRDDLVERLGEARVTIAERAEAQAASRLALEQMLLEPGKHRFQRISCRELGQAGCGAWEVRPRLGLIGMLMGWWQVKLSSGCPLSRAAERRRGPSESPATGGILSGDARDAWCFSP